MQTVEMAALTQQDLVDATTLGSGPIHAPLPRYQVALLVAAGGALGGVLRLAVALMAPTVTTPTLVEIPWSTLSVNVLGSLVLGVLIGAIEVRSLRPWVFPLLGTGVCGGFTSLSTVVLEGSAMIGADFPLAGFGYAMLTIVGGIGAVVLGLLAGGWGMRRLTRSAASRPGPAAHSSATQGPAPQSPVTPSPETRSPETPGPAPRDRGAHDHPNHSPADHSSSDHGSANRRGKGADS